MNEEAASLNPRPQWRVVGWLMPRAVALCFALAFWSWGIQCIDLVGESGILPAASFFDAIKKAGERDGVSYFWDLPSLLYWNASDRLLVTSSWLGFGLSLLALWRFQAVCLSAAWVLYLSHAVAGQDFMGFQWDALLLEAGILAILLAARRFPAPPSRAFVFLLHWLVFRLMLQSGIVKLWSGDPMWEQSTALVVHFETQPLPTWIAWYTHQLPKSMLIAGCWGMYIVELALPFVMWIGKWGRLVACAAYIGLMGGVALTGNYNFFNLLTALLSLSLLHDDWWPSVVKGKLSLSPPESPPLARKERWQVIVATAVVVLSLIAADLDLATRRVTGRDAFTPKPVAEVFQKVIAPWRSINAYGLFQNMTDSRIEIEVEVSTDGTTFYPLKFHWKPDDLEQKPMFVAPYQPRLDWQMWFLPFGGGRIPGWFASFLNGLAEGRSGPWNLIDRVNTKVQQSDVRAARAVAWKYEFTTAEERSITGEWWKRSYLGAFTQVVRSR